MPQIVAALSCLPMVVIPSRRRLLCALPLLATSCTGWFFTGIQYPDRSRPVVLIETKAGAECGVATSEGILFLGRTAKEGVCRVHLFLGGQPIVEDGRIDGFGGVYSRAVIDRKHEAAPVWTRKLERGEGLIAQRWRGGDVENIDVRVSTDVAVDGDVLDAPDVELPLGTGVFKEADGRLHFVGLVAATADLEDASLGSRRFVLFTGPDRLAEALAVPERTSTPPQIKYRPDSTWIVEPPPREVDKGDKK